MTGFSKFLKQVAWTIPVAIAFTDCVACVIRVDGQSMQPTLNPEPGQKDWVLVEKVSYKLLRRYQRGDVAVFWSVEMKHLVHLCICPQLHMHGHHADGVAAQAACPAATVSHRHPFWVHVPGHLTTRTSSWSSA